MTVKLPTEKTEPKTALEDLNLLVYGPPKIGKSTFCSNADHALFLATEAGLNALAVYQIPISNWTEMLEALALVAKGEHPFKTIVIDTADNAFQFCQDHVCKENGWKHPSDGAYGKGFGSVNSEFQRVLTKLSNLPYGLILVSHAKDREVETRTGTIVKTGPTLPEGARKIVTGFADVIAFCDVETETGADGKQTYRRVIRTKPTTHYEAGDRTGRLPETLPLDYATFVAALTSAKRAAEPPSAPASEPKQPRAKRAPVTFHGGPGDKGAPAPTPDTASPAATAPQTPAQ